MDNQQEIFPIVDEDGKVTGSATRGECHSGSKLLHPVVHLHVFNSRGDIYLQRRPEWKDIQPGKWDTAVGGHIDFGETPEEALLREVREELGITDFTPEFVDKYVFESKRERELVYVHRTIYDGEISPSAEELDGGRFWSMQEIREAMGKDILTPNFESEFKRCFKPMNILILSGSPRKGGNTDLLVEAFVKGASQKHHVEVVSVHDYKVNPCLGCNACFMSKDSACAQKDDMSIIYEKMSQANMLVIASPVYFYGISAQLKAIIDRFHNPIRDSFHIQKMALLLVGAASLPELFDAILTEYRLCLNFFNIEDAGKVLVRRVKDKGDIKNTDALNEAYKLGCSI